MSPHRLSVGLLIDSYLVPDWAYRALEESIRRDDIHLAALVINQAPAEAQPSRRAKTQLLHDLSWFGFSRLDRWVTNLLPSKGPDPRVQRDIRQLAPEAISIAVQPRMVRSSDYFPEDHIRQIQDLGLDVLFRIGFRIIRGEILLRGARFGIWSFHHGDIRNYRGQPSGFWEFMEGEGSVGAVLQVLTEDLDGGHVLARASGPARNALTWGSILNRLYWHASEMLPKCLHLLAQGGESAFQSMVKSNARLVSVHDRPLRLKPGNLPAIRASSRIMWGLVKVLLKRLITRPLERLNLLSGTQWAILIGKTEQLGPHGFSLNMRKHQMLRPPVGHSWADPFILHHEGRAFLFFEDFPHRTGTGHISWMELDESLHPKAMGVALEEPFHLSFPNVFAHDGDYYMVPESRAARQVRLYRCLEFPARWEFHSVMLEATSAADTTLLQHEGLWWLFTSSSSAWATADHGLFIYFSASLFGPWTPHPCNPVTQDVDTTRPAGRVFHSNGRLIRPAQISTEYGWGVSLLEITKLNERAFEERRIDRIEPGWKPGIHGVHSFNISQGIIATDCKLIPDWRR